MTSSPSCVTYCVTYAGLHPATYGQACEVLVACIPHKLARHASLYVVKSKPARFWRRQHIANDLATVLDIRMRRPARNRAYIRVFRVTKQLLCIVIFLWTQYQSLCLKHCFQSFLHLFTGEFSAIVNAVQIAGDVKEHRGRPLCNLPALGDQHQHIEPSPVLRVHSMRRERAIDEPMATTSPIGSTR